MLKAINRYNSISLTGNGNLKSTELRNYTWMMIRLGYLTLTRL